MKKLRKELKHQSKINRSAFMMSQRWMLMLVSCLILSLDAHAVICDVSSSAVNFGNYNVYATTNPGSQGQITVSCNPITSYTIALNGGTYGTIAQRKLRSATTGELMLYNLYIDAAHSNLWGDGTNYGNTLTSSSATPIPVYGVLPPLQDVSVGTYSDNVAITVNF